MSTPPSQREEAINTIAQAELVSITDEIKELIRSIEISDGIYVIGDVSYAYPDVIQRDTRSFLKIDSLDDFTISWLENKLGVRDSGHIYNFHHTVRRLLSANDLYLKGINSQNSVWQTSGSSQFSTSHAALKKLIQDGRGELSKLMKKRDALNERITQHLGIEI